MQDDPQDTGYLILSLEETMEESRRLRQELRSGGKDKRVEGASPEQDKTQGTPPESA